MTNHSRTCKHNFTSCFPVNFMESLEAESPALILFFPFLTFSSNVIMFLLLGTNVETYNKNKSRMKISLRPFPKIFYFDNLIPLFLFAYSVTSVLILVWMHFQLSRILNVSACMFLCLSNSNWTPIFSTTHLPGFIAQTFLNCPMRVTFDLNIIITVGPGLAFIVIHSSELLISEHLKFIQHTCSRNIDAWLLLGFFFPLSPANPCK